ncbi:MAG: prephenate dehydratase [Rhodobacteraceae bacterium]|nr:prephenate dehydratase [Paracoccaceae bacterium]
MKISFQGELGSYSHQACGEAFPDAQPLPCSTFEAAMAKVKNCESKYAIIPVENSTYGRVADIYYLLPNTGLFIVKEHFLRVHINLLALPGVAISEVRKAMSHSVLLGQCEKFLRKHNIAAISGVDTAGSAKLVSQNNDRTIAALASPLAGRIYGLETIKEEIEDMKNNTTRFLVMSKDVEKIDLSKSKQYMTTIVFQVRNIPAALYKAMGGFATNGVNLVKLESYMVAGSFTSTQFYADIEGHPDQEPVQRALDELNYFTSMVEILGVYGADSFRN